MFNLDPELVTKIQAVLKGGNPQAIAELIRGTIAGKLNLEDWLSAVFGKVTGTIFTAPTEVAGRRAMKVVRGQEIESFKVANRKVYLAPERYVSKPSIDAGDLKRGDVASVVDLINFAKQGLQDLVMEDGHILLSSACKHGDANFSVINDTGDDANGVPTYLPKLRRKINKAISKVNDSTLSRTMAALIGRKVLVSDIIENGGITDLNKARFELSSDIVPGEYRGVPVVSLSGAVNQDTGRVVFPDNEIYAVAQGAGSYSQVSDLDITALPQQNVQLAWEIWEELIIALWFREQVYRMYIIDAIAGDIDKVVQADAGEVVLRSTKYIDATTVTNITINIYTGTFSAGGGQAYATGGVSVDPTGTYITLKFATPLSAATYKVTNTVGLKDVGATAFTARADSAALTFVI